MENYIKLKIKNKIQLTKEEIAYYVLFMAKKHEVSKYIRMFRK